MNILTLNRLETHDRLLQYNKQADYISQGCYDCINKRPAEFENYPFYVFAHCRTADDGFTKRMIWQPRLVKPSAQTNSMLFRIVPPNLDDIHIIWIIPARELWDNFKPGKMTHNATIWESINLFQIHRRRLEKKEDGDVEQEKARCIYRQIADNVIKRSAEKDALRCSLSADE